MNNKIVTLALGALLFALCLSAEAQQQPGKVPRIGFLRRAAPEPADFEAFRQGLRDLGYFEGKNIITEQRYAHGLADRLPGLAAELVGLKVDILVVDGTATAAAAKSATTTIPIVFTLAGDPVATGLVASLARPGGNLTGLSQIAPELSGKRLELLKEAASKVSRVAVLRNPDNPATGVQLKETEAAARAIGLQLRVFELREPKELDNAFSSMVGARADALVQLTDGMFFTQRVRIVELAAKGRLPAIYEAREFVEAGGLMSYGVSFIALYRRAATYVDKILKGAKPADVPVEQPTKFELVINLKTAKQIGLTIPPNVLARADRVIR